MDEHMLHHIDDVRRLVAACALRGLAIGERDAYEAWCSYSETSAAGWLALADDDDLLFDVVRDRIGSPAAPGDFRHTS